MKTRTPRLLTAVLIALVIGTVGCATGQYYISDTDSQIIQQINSNGVGSRKVLPEMRPVAGGKTATYRYSGSDNGIVMVAAPYAGRPKIGDGSVLNITGPVTMQGMTFNGNTQDPLTFFVSEKYGLVHMYGKGTVRRPNGETIVFP